MYCSLTNKGNQEVFLFTKFYMLGFHLENGKDNIILLEPLSDSQVRETIFVSNITEIG